MNNISSQSIYISIAQKDNHICGISSSRERLEEMMNDSRYIKAKEIIEIKGHDIEDIMSYFFTKNNFLKVRKVSDSKGYKLFNK